MTKIVQIVAGGAVVNSIMVDDAARIVAKGARLEWGEDGFDAPKGATFMEVEGAAMGWLVDGKTLVAPPEPDSLEPAPLHRLGKAELWRRVSDKEADALDAQLSAAPLRLRRLFEAATHLDNRDEDYPALRAGVVAALGEERAAAVLAPDH